MNLIDKNIVDLSSYLRSNRALIELDISWNRITPSAMIKFLELLGKLN